MDAIDYSCGLEKTNVRNNVQVVLDVMESQQDNGTIHVYNFKDMYGQIMSRLQSSLKSVLNLYIYGDVSFEYFNHYLPLHNRVVEKVLSLISVQSCRDLKPNDFEVVSFIQVLVTLNELASSVVKPPTHARI